jgi:MFS family permease
VDTFAGIRVSETNVGWLRAIRGFQRNAIILFISAGILGFAYWGITYLLTNLFIVRLGYGTEVVGNLNALFYLLHMAFSVPAGALGMRIGSRRAMIAGGVLALVGWAVGPTASFLLEPGERMAALASSRVLSSIGGALFIVNANPALMGSVRPEHRTYAFAFNGAVISLTTFLGSICGGFLPPLFAALSGGNLLSSRPYGFSLWTGVLVLAPSLAALFFFRETGKGAEIPQWGGGARGRSAREVSWGCALMGR